ncbi:acyl-CoA thioesterase [Psychrobacter sp. LV10R520-6]|uniref:acyl-CoA thioesterase n=1 Tax=Psychrobacter sp. LV10R520-6 TaxID=1415574 RepID=UPI0024C61C17|nr:acyl-CoA thioesterase [Psychrobacter sp. LV10R520-6]SNT69177.1 Acyl-CoA thioesterase FadM [Psychrobacter sp. LV10R520-6]
MNMLLRFFIMISLLKQQLKQQSVDGELSIEMLTKPVVRRYRILPHDMGFRDHLPNYRYLSFIELNITRWLLACCHQKSIEPLQWIIAMQEMVYLKEIKFLDKMTVSSTLAGWDHKYIYFEHRFFVKNQLMGVGMTKFVLMNKQGKCEPNSLNMLGEQLNDVITSWNKHQIAVKSAPTP